jgi:hypothetical protein
MAAPRKWTDDQVADVVLRHVAGETMRTIGTAVGRDPSVVSRLLRAPDVASLVAQERAAASTAVQAVEAERSAAVSAERRRATSLKSTRKHAAKRAAAAPSGARKGRANDVFDKDTGQMRPFSGGVIAGVYTWPAGAEGARRDPDFHVHYSKYGTADGAGEAAFFKRRDAERALEVDSDIRILLADGSTSQYDRLDPQEREHAANFLSEYAPTDFPDRDALLTFLADARADIDLRNVYDKYNSAESPVFDPAVKYDRADAAERFPGLAATDEPMFSDADLAEQ